MKKSLSQKDLKDMIRKEAAQLQIEAKFGKPEAVEDRAKDTEETEADEYADSLEKHVDMLAALKIEESKLKRRLNIVIENKNKLLAAVRGKKGAK